MIWEKVNQIYNVQMIHGRQLNYLSFGQDAVVETNNNEFSNRLPVRTAIDLETFDAELSRDENMKARLVCIKKISEK